MHSTHRSIALPLLLVAVALVGRLSAHPAATAAGEATHTLFLPLAMADQPLVRVSALYYDSLTPNEPDEAFQLRNVTSRPVNLAGYQVSDGRRTVVFPALELPAGGSLWCTGDAVAFRFSFGVAANCEYGSDTDPTVPNLSGTALRFANTGGQVLLRNPAGAPVDTLVYENGNPSQSGWQGPAVQPYAPTTAFPAEGQILYRKPPWGGLITDSDTRTDWAQDPDDPIAGQRVQYPGWDLARFGLPPTLIATGTLTVALAPDNLFDVVSRTLASAHESIAIESYSFEHPAVAEALAAQARRGVTVTVLLEGDPVGGITDQERYCAQVIEAAGGQVWFMAGDRNDATHKRYAQLHAKFAVIDQRLLLLSSENFSGESMPDDDKADDTAGRRGAALLTDARPLVDHALAVFWADFDPSNHSDLVRWAAADPKYGAPPAGFTPARDFGGNTYQLVQPRPRAVTASFNAQVVQAPEAALLPPELGGVLGLLAQAGPGDTVLVQQLFERVHWGAGDATPQTAPNPRLAAMIDAARRGATVRLLLDAYFDRGDNAATVAYVSQVAQAEGLNLQARLGNPTGNGVHNKMVLVQAGSRGWVHVGSLNGGEASTKRNRELALQVQSDAVFDYLAAAFWQDWQRSGGG